MGCHNIYIFRRNRLCFWGVKFSESHVDISIVDHSYVVIGMIGIPITGSKIRNYDRV